MTKLKVLDLFSGIGGFSLGLERTGGFETVAFCEIDPFCRQVLAKHWPTVRQYHDVRTLTADALERDGITPNVIVGGFPCQGLSAAGARAGLSDARSGLWSEFARLIGELRPIFVLLENSPELLDNGFGDVLGSLASLGYNAQWDCIPASALGAPHDRDRIWALAYPQTVAWVHQPDLRQEFRSWLSDDNHPWSTDAWDAPETAVCRVDDGVPNRVDRTGALGNSIIPLIPELIGGAVLAGLGHTRLAA
jgi:DNA (cytosine-5)-methyltransferase 1